MRFGAFTLSQMKTVSRSLEAKGIFYEVQDDQALLAEQEAAWKATPPGMGRRGAQYDPAFLFVELDDAVYQSRRTELEALGLLADVEEPDFSVEDYVCPACGKVVATGPGMCPKHGTTLLTWGDHVAAKRGGTPASPQAFPRWALFTLAAILALALLYKFVILKSA